MSNEYETNFVVWLFCYFVAVGFESSRTKIKLPRHGIYVTVPSSRLITFSETQTKMFVVQVQIRK